jgi:hypothetical protein
MPAAGGRRRVSRCLDDRRLALNVNSAERAMPHRTTSPGNTNLGGPELGHNTAIFAGIGGERTLLEPSLPC